MAINELFNEELQVVNIGLVSFKEALEATDYAVVQVDWSPPAGGDERVLDALQRIAALSKGA